MRGGEGVVDIDVAELRELLRRKPDRSFLLLCGSGCSPDRECRRPSSHRRLSSATSPMQSSAKATGRLEDVRRARARPVSAIPSDRGLSGRPKCDEQDHLAALVGDFGDGRRDALDAGRVGDLAVFHRHVEIDAHENALVPSRRPDRGCGSRSCASHSSSCGACSAWRERLRSGATTMCRDHADERNDAHASWSWPRVIRAACPSRRRCPTCGWRSPIRCRTKTSRAPMCRP